MCDEKLLFHGCEIYRENSSVSSTIKQQCGTEISRPLSITVGNLIPYTVAPSIGAVLANLIPGQLDEEPLQHALIQAQCGFQEVVQMEQEYPKRR